MRPQDLPPYSTVQRHFHDWRDSGLLQIIPVALASMGGEQGGLIHFFTPSSIPCRQFDTKAMALLSRGACLSDLCSPGPDILAGAAGF